MVAKPLVPGHRCGPSASASRGLAIDSPAGRAPARTSGERPRRRARGPGSRLPARGVGDYASREYRRVSRGCQAKRRTAAALDRAETVRRHLDVRRSDGGRVHPACVVCGVAAGHPSPLRASLMALAARVLGRRAARVCRIRADRPRYGAGRWRRRDERETLGAGGRRGLRGIRRDARSGGFAVDYWAFRRTGADRREALARVLGLGFPEYAILSLAALVASVLLYWISTEVPRTG